LIRLRKIWRWISQKLWGIRCRKPSGTISMIRDVHDGIHPRFR